MRSKLRHRAGVSLLLLLIHGLQSGVLAQSLPDNTRNIPPAYNPDGPTSYDQVIASMPRKAAPVASVALATINIALHNARLNAEQALCGGLWAPRGRLLHQQGPSIALMRLSPHKTVKNWHYNTLREAQPLACKTVSRADFFLEMSRHLPDWILIRPAGQFTAYHKGKNILLNPQTVAVR